MLNKTFLKIISVCSFIVGAILGIFALIPLFTQTIFLIQMLICAPFIIIYLRKLDIIKTLEMDKCLIMGAIIGCISFLGLSVIFFPFASLVNIIFKAQSFLWVKVLMVNFGFVLPMILFISLLSALLNMFSAFLTMSVLQYISKK